MLSNGSSCIRIGTMNGRRLYCDMRSRAGLRAELYTAGGAYRADRLVDRFRRRIFPSKVNHRVTGAWETRRSC